MPRFAVLTIGFLCILFSAGPVPASSEAVDQIPGPVMAHVVRVIDGDTIVVDAFPWPAHSLRISVRLRGIDAAEMRSSCPAERRTAQKARDLLETLTLQGDHVLLSNISGGKYYGRVLADVSVGQSNLATSLLGQGLASVYSGGRCEKLECALWPSEP